METVDIHFKVFDTSVFGHRPTLLSLWARWCRIHIDKITDLETIRQEYAGRINVVGVLFDAVTGDRKSISGYSLEAALTTLKARKAL